MHQCPLVLYCDRFDRGSRQVKRELVDLLMKDYDVSLFQRVGIRNYYTKDHIITFVIGVCLGSSILLYVESFGDRLLLMRTHEDLSSDMELLVYVFYGFVVIFYLAECHGIYEIDYITSIFGGSCISKKNENGQRILSNCNLYVTRLMRLSCR